MVNVLEEVQRRLDSIIDPSDNGSTSGYLLVVGDL